MAGQSDGKVAPKMVRESDLIAIKEREKKALTELAEAKKQLAQLQGELKIAKASGVDDEDVKAIQEMLLKQSQEVRDRKDELDKRETSLTERERESLVKTLASTYSVDLGAIKDAEDPEKEALRLVNERLIKEKEKPTPAEQVFEHAEGAVAGKKSFADMTPEELAKAESQMKAEYASKHI